MEIDTADGQVIITRKMSESRSISKINGETCTVSQIKQLAEELLDIHGQHEHQSLLYQERQLAILDAYGKVQTAASKREVEASYQVYRRLQKELEQYQMDEEARAREIAFLEFEIQEIEEADLKKGEDEQLEQQYRKMSNARKIADSLNQVHMLTGYQENSGAGEQVGRALRELGAVADCDEQMKSMLSVLNDIDGLLNDFNREVSGYMTELTFSEEEFFRMEKRLDELNHLKSKYGNSIEEIFLYKKKQSEKLEQLQNFEARKAELLEELRCAEGCLLYTSPSPRD